jgi:hypothetical protein
VNATDARLRFLRAIVERLPLERVAEVHLFSPLRHGGWESGVAVIAAAPEPAEGAASPRRLTVYRAQYRWARKGPERGKWEVELVAEADAPLDVVTAVVRGVHRRAGEEASPERLSAAALRAALADQPWLAPT